MIGPLVPRKDGGWHCTRCSKPPAPLLGDKYRDVLEMFWEIPLVSWKKSSFDAYLMIWEGFKPSENVGIFVHISSVALNDYPKFWFLKGHRLSEYTCFVISNHPEGKKAGTANESNNGNRNFYFWNFHRDQTASGSKSPGFLWNLKESDRSDRMQEPQILSKHLGSLSIIAPQKKTSCQTCLSLLNFWGGGVVEELSSSFGGGESQTLHPDGWNSVCLRKHMSHEKYPGWLDYIGDNTTQLYRDFNKPL